MISKEQGAEKAEGASETLIFKIDVPANRFVSSQTHCFVATPGKVDPRYMKVFIKSCISNCFC